MRIDHITFTRFIAALTVVFFHYGNQVFPLNIPLLDNVLKAGPIAVNYFYLLSGFIMAYAYYQPENKASFSAKCYWLARFARIYPVYLLALLLIAITKTSDPDFTSALFLNTTLLQSWIPNYALSMNSPGWSLSVEAFFYLCFPVVLAFIYRYGINKMAVFGLAIWVATQLFHTFLLNSQAYSEHNTLHNFIYYNPLMHLNAFILGVVAGVLFKSNHSSIQRLSEHANAGLAISLIVLALIIGFQKDLVDTLGFDLALTNGQLAPLFLLSIVFLALNKGLIARLFSHPWLVLLGEASFSLYILQRPVHSIYERTIGSRIDLPEALHFYAYVILLIVISIASYKLFETPTRKYIRSWSSKQNRKSEEKSTQTVKEPGSQQQSYENI